MATELTRSPVSELNAARNAKALMDEWLKRYFDGAMHAIGLNAPVVFPMAEIRFDQGPATQPLAGSEIRVILRENRVRQWSSPTADGEGYQVLVPVEWEFSVRVQVPGEGQANYLANQIGDLLNALLLSHHERWPLGYKGARISTVRRMDTVASNDYAMRYLVATGHLAYTKL